MEISRDCVSRGIVTEIEKCIECGFVLTVLLDIEGAFNQTSVENIFQGARKQEVSDTVETKSPL